MSRIDIGQVKGKRVLLVGGTGFIGRHILRKLVEVGSNVTVLSLFSKREYDILQLSECNVLKGGVTCLMNVKHYSPPVASFRNVTEE